MFWFAFSVSVIVTILCGIGIIYNEWRIQSFEIKPWDRDPKVFAAIFWTILCFLVGMAAFFVLERLANGG